MGFVMDYLKFLHFEYNFIFLWKHGDTGPFRILYKIKVNIENKTMDGLNRFAHSMIDCQQQNL